MRSQAVLALSALVCLACSDDAPDPKTWREVATGTSLVGNGVTRVAVDRQGNFLGMESTLGLVISGANPSSPWQPTPPFGGSSATWFGTSKTAPLVNKDGRVWQSTPTGFVDRGPFTKAGAYQSVVDVDDSGALYVVAVTGALARVRGDVLEALPTVPGGAGPGDPYVTRQGKVFSVNAVSSPGEIYDLSSSPAPAVPVLGGRGCPNADKQGCNRTIFVMGLDLSGALYVATRTVSADRTQVAWSALKYVSGAWQDLPPLPALVDNRNLNCTVAGNGTAYCQRIGPETQDSSGVDELLVLAPNGSAWESVGDLPGARIGYDVAPDFSLAARDDGRVAATCCALGNGNDSLWVSE